MSTNKFPYFPSLYDTATRNEDIWTNLFSNRNDKERPVTSEQEPWPSSLAVIKYQPLDFYCPPAGSSTAWSEVDDVCELAIRLKEIELLNLVGAGFDSRRYLFLKTLKDEKTEELLGGKADDTLT
nr:PREDICTED: uncharacterized protein C11orf91 homolog [Lepisosteus oculatus]